MSNLSDVFPIAEYFKANARSRQVFEAIAASSTISGWSLAQTLQMDPDELEPLLNEMRAQSLIQGDGPGLDAYFYLTELGFRFGSFAS